MLTLSKHALNPRLVTIMGAYESKFWLSDTWGMNRRERASGTYRPYIPDTLATREIRLTPEAAAAVAHAQANILSLNASPQPLADTEPLARLILRAEALASSKIEGLTMNAGKLLEYEALDELGVDHRIDATESAVLSNIAAMHEAISLRDAFDDITLDTICAINRKLLEHTTYAELGGTLRTQQNWIGGNNANPIGAAYVPPSPERVPKLMDDLVNFINTSLLPPLAVAAIAHAQLETIHPFADGNGRTGRALVHMVLKSSNIAPHTVPPISLVLATDRLRYIDNLVAYRTDDAKPTSMTFDDAASDWVEFFAHITTIACERATEFEATIANIQAEWRERFHPRANSAAALLMEKLPGNPVVSIDSTARLTQRSKEAARTALHALADAGILRQNARNKKSNLYVATDIINAFTGYERALATTSGDTSAENPVRPVPQRPKAK